MKDFEFKPKQWVLVRDSEEERWALAQYSHYNKDATFEYRMLLNVGFRYCIPYEGNEHLLGTTNPYEEPYEPKDGDFVAIKVYEGVVTGVRPWICIFKSITDAINAYTGLGLDGELVKGNNVDYNKDWMEHIRPATEEEKNLLLSKLHEIGKDWDSEKKDIVDYEPPYEPKDGDFVVSGWNEDNTKFCKWIAIVKGDNFEKYFYEVYDGYFLDGVNKGHFFTDFLECASQEYTRAATEEEKQLFLDKLHEAGKDWNAEQKQIVDWKWMPNRDDPYFRPLYQGWDVGFVVDEVCWESLDDSFDKTHYERGWVFRTEEECQAMCDRLNDAIKNVK